MYFIKTKGTDKVPDFVQIRDDDFALIEQIKFSSLEKKINNIFGDKASEVCNIIVTTDYEQLTKI